MPPFILMSHQSLMLALILLQGIRCDAVRTCQFGDSKFFLEDDKEGRDASAGECSFDKNKFCSYSQACTDKDAKNWTLINGEAVCPGKGGVFDSFSVLLSPLITFKQDYCLKFNYSQFSPGKLSVFLATPSQMIDIKPEEAGEGNFSRLIQLRSSVGKIGFKARSPNANQEITLSYVKLQAGSCESVPACSSPSRGTLPVCVWNVSFPPEIQAPTAQISVHRYAGVIAGILAYIGLVVVMLIVGFVLWRRFKQKECSSDHGARAASNQAVVVETSQTAAALPQRHPVARKKSSYNNHAFGSPAEDEHTYAEIVGAEAYAISKPLDVIALEDGCPGRKRSAGQSCFDPTFVLPSGVDKKNEKNCSRNENPDGKLSLQTKASHPYANTYGMDLNPSKHSQGQYSIAHSCTENSPSRDSPSSRDDKHIVLSDGHVAAKPTDLSRGGNVPGTEEDRYEGSKQVAPYSVLAYSSDTPRAASSRGEGVCKAYDHAAPRGNGCYDTAHPMHSDKHKYTVTDSDYNHI